MSEQLYTNIEITEAGPAEVKITGEIPTDVANTYRPRVIRAFTETMEIPGFRKGHVPEKIVIERIGEPSILAEIAEHALKDAYPKIIEEKNLEVIGRPNVELTKLAPGNPIGFSIMASLYPTIKLPDYQKLAKETFRAPQKIEVTEKEVDDGISNLLEQFDKAGKSEEEAKDAKQLELTDELVKQWGDFKNVAEFKEKFKESVRIDKERKEREKQRVEAAEKLIKESIITMPNILIESELGSMLAQLRGDIERMGQTFEGYLAHIKKTEEDLRAEWKEEAKKRASLQLILNEIARKEKLEPKPEDIEREAHHMKEHVPQDTPMERIRQHVALMLMNENVFRFLEEQNKETGVEKKAQPAQKKES